MESKFEWNDELVSEFVNSDHINERFALKDAIEQFKASKQRKPLWKSCDGIPVYHGDHYFWVDSEMIIRQGKADQSFIIDMIRKSFTTSEAALSYIDENEKKYSIKDVREAYLKQFDKVFNGCNVAEFKMVDFISELQKKK